MSKYGARPTVVNGINFDSVMEADYYRHLLEEKKAGRVLRIGLQPTIELQPSFRLDGELFRPITYTPDFIVEYANGKVRYIDVKGMDTPQGKIKYKMYKYISEYGRNGVELIWVARSKKYSESGWIDWFKLQKIRRQNKRRNVS